MKYETIQEFTETLPELYDKEAIEFDYEHNNFDLENADEEAARYFTPEIVATSIINGQFTQARAQFHRYGLTYSGMAHLLTQDQLKILLR